LPAEGYNLILEDRTKKDWLRLLQGH
jgi:hypothetical protein